MKPGKLMGNTVRELARTRPDLCDESGRGFAVVNYNFPLMLTHTLDALQKLITQEYVSGNSERADALAEQRIGLMQVVYEGDLGENHTELFLADHPELAGLTTEEYAALPYHRFCQGLLQETNPIALIGAMTRNEEGSIGEIVALAETGMVRRGVFSETHMEEEVEQGRISEGIRGFFMNDPSYRPAFEKGMELHDRLYLGVPDEARRHMP